MGVREARSGTNLDPYSSRNFPLLQLSLRLHRAGQCGGLSCFPLGWLCLFLLLLGGAGGSSSVDGFCLLDAPGAEVTTRIEIDAVVPGPEGELRPARVAGDRLAVFWVVLHDGLTVR